VPGKLITIRNVCDRYGLSDKTIRRKIKAGELQAYRVGERLIKLDAAQVEATLMRPATPAATSAEAADRVAAYIEKLLAEAPKLTDQQRTALAELLRPARCNGGAV
jgi:excisionase family DNA binding protein